MRMKISGTLFFDKNINRAGNEISYNDPHFVISINILAQNQITGKDDEDNDEDSDNKHDVVGDVKDASFVDKS